MTATPSTLGWLELSLSMAWHGPREIYQTIRKRRSSQIDYEGAPYFCNNPDAWLGPGYYFWDVDLRLAHTWGQARYNDQYRIVQFSIYLDDTCLDLVDPDGRRALEQAARLLDLTLDGELQIHEIIGLMVTNRLFPYVAIRVEGDPIQSEFLSGRDPSLRGHAKMGGNKARFTFVKPTQICLLYAEALSLHKICIVED